jgi:DNA (cytosine-5)-methyltransferase 1
VSAGARPTALEFFAGIGLVRLGLERAGFSVAWSNDIDPSKHAMYVGNFPGNGRHEFVLGDVAGVKVSDLPGGAALAWASFPCTDLSLAGSGLGLDGAQSGTFWQFARVLGELGAGRPPVVVLENVMGLATRKAGRDFVAVVAELNRLGYSVDALVLDAARFVPQSRPRLFLVGSLAAPASAAPVVASDPLRPVWLQELLAGSGLRTHRAARPEPPALRWEGLGSFLATFWDSSDVWWRGDRLAAFFGSLSHVQAARLDGLRRQDRMSWRTAYRRTRGGLPVWEARSDGVAGCLRTARGGSSRQAVVQAGHGEFRVRWMVPQEYATLMGASRYKLGGLSENQIMSGFGDAVCVPVVAWLAEHYLMPLVRGGLL